MLFSRYFRRRRSGAARQAPRRRRMSVELLEDRSLPSATFVAGLGQPPTLSSPGQFAEFDGALFFSGNGGLFRTDGTPASTTLIRSGGAGNLTAVNDTLFFTSGFQLWKSDGTPAGTTQVADLPVSASPFLNFTASNGKLFFTAVHPTLGKELFVSDGTEAGTGVIKDILPGDKWSSPESLIDVNGTLFFTANDRFLGGPFGFAGNRELWKSDGTPEGTVKVKEVVPGDASGTFRNVTNVNGTLYFTSGHISSHGLWKSDGTEEGTVLVKPQSEITPPPANGLIGEAVSFNGMLFFTVSNGTFGGARQLWRSDGTSAGTVLVTEVPGTGSDLIGNLTAVDNTLYFAAGRIVFPGVLQPGVFESAQLWKSDGTAAGTVLVTDRLQIAGAELQSRFVGHNGMLFFTANDGASGWEVWQTDGTDAGTTLVQDVNPASASAFPLGVTGYLPTLKAAGGRLYFAADRAPGGDRELWVVTPSSSNQPPVLGAITDQTVSEGGTLTLTATATDPDAGQTLTFSLVDGPAGASIDPVSGAFTWTPDDGPATVTVTVRVTDSGDPALSDTRSFTITVLNVAPTPSVSGPSSGTAGQTLSFTLTATDPSGADRAAGFTYVIDWGDGSAPQTVDAFPDSGSGVVVSHAYPLPGSYTVRITAIDKDGGSGATELFTPVVITAAPAGESDLTWSGGGILAPPEVAAGEAFTIGRTFAVGGEPVGPFTIAYWASLDDIFGNEDDFLVGLEFFDGAAPGIHSGTSPAFTIGAPGTYFLFAVLDSDGQVDETDEDNNVVMALATLLVTGT